MNLHTEVTGKTGLARILIIDDEQLICELMRDMLSAWGYDVVTETDAALGLGFLESNTCDLAITDIFMPDKDGLEVIHEVRRLHPGLKVIAMSGGPHRSIVDFLPEAEDLGANATVSKPIDRFQLLQIIQHLLDGASPSS